MKHLAILCSAFIATGVFAEAPLNRVSNPVLGRYVVILDANAPAATYADALAREVGAHRIHIFSHVTNGFSVQASPAALQALRNSRFVSEVWEVATFELADMQSSPPTGLDRIDQRYLPLSDSYNYAVYSTPINIYVVDSGVDPYDDLGSRVIDNINFSATEAGYVDPNDYTDYGLPLYDSWHGTPVATIAAGTTYGVAKYAKIINVRIASSQPTANATDAAIKAADWITARAKSYPGEVHVANASFVFKDIDYGEIAITRSINAGVGWVFAAGNYADDACLYSPARLGVQFAGAMTVGAMNPTTDEASYTSNQWSCVEIFAPTGVQWATTAYTGDGSSPFFAGTSAAAPHVTGAFGIRWAELFQNSIDPEKADANAANTEERLKYLATKDVLKLLRPDTPNLLIYSLRPKTRAVGS